MPVSLPDDADDPRSPFSGIAPVLLNEKFVVHSYDGGSQQSRSQYDVKHVLIPTLEPFHCSDRGCKFNLVLKCSEDFTLTHFYISGPGPRCTEPIRSGLVWVCSDLPKDLEITDVYDDLRPDELESHQPMDEDRGGSCTNESSSTWDPHPPCLRFQTDVESREAEVELQRWQEGRYVIVRFLDTHFAEEQVNVDVGMIGLVGHFGRCGRHQVPVGPWMRRRVQQAWVHARPLQRTFSSGGWVCDGRDFTGGCRASLTDFHQTTMYNSRFHCSVTGFDLCEACAHDTSLGKVTDASVQADIEALQSASTCKLVGTRLRNLWKRNWLHAVPRYFRHGLLQRVMASLQSCLDHLTQSGRARAILEEEASGRSRGRLASTGTVLHPDPQQSAALRALLQLVSDLVHSILVGVRPGCDIQVNDLAWAPVVSDVHGPPCRWERCRVISLPPNFPAVNPSSTCPSLEEDDDMDASGVASASFLVSSRDWKGKRQVQAENLWKVTKQLNDEDVVITTAGLLTEVRRGAHCDVNEVRRLVCHSADLSAANAEGQTALLGAAKSGCSYQVFTLLLEARACPDQSDRSGQTALQLLQKTITLGSSMDEVSNAEQCTQLLRRHGAEPCASEPPCGLSEVMASLEEDLATEVLGPLLALRGTSSALQGFRPPPLEALETALLLVRSLPVYALQRALFQSQDSNSCMDFLNGFLCRAIEGTSGATSALYAMRLARALKARALEEPRLLTTLCRHGVYRWAKRLIATRDPQQAGCFGPPLAQEKAVPNEDLLREATSLCEELASLASVGPLTKPRALSGAVRLLDQACAGSDAQAMKQALQAVRDLLFGVGCGKCTAFEMESVNFAGRLLRLLQGSGKLQQDRWAIFEEVFQLREPKAPKAAMRRLLEVLQAMVCTAECFLIWRYKRDRGLKALTEPVQLRLEHWQRASKEPSQKGRLGRDVVSVMVEPLVSLSEILRYLLRVTPVVTEEYLTFCHTLVGCSLRDTASGEVVKVLSFELLLTDCPVPIHTVQCAAGETQRLLLALRDYEYAVSESRCPAAEFKASLSALHAIGGSHQYAKLLDELDEHLRTGNVEPSEESPDREVRRRSRDIRRGRRLCTSDSEDDAGTTSSSSSGAEVRRRGTKRCAEAAAKHDSIAGEAFKRAVQAARACDQATEVLHTERRRVAAAMLALNAGDMPGMSSVDPVSRVHSVTLAVPEEIPLDVFWPMVQEDIMGAVQEFYPRGVPPQVQEVLQTGTPKDGAIPVAQRLTLEEAEMLAARLAHLSQTAVAVDLSAVQELKRLPRRQSGDSEDSRDVRWAQFTPRQGRQAAPPTAPAVAARVRLRSSPDGSDWISGVVVGHGPPNAPWRCSNGSRQSSVEALLDIVDDQGLLWEQLPPTQVKLPAVQKGSGGTTSMPHGAENRSFLETRRLPPPPPVAREVPPAQQRSRESSREEVPFLQPLELPQPPPPPLAQPFIPVGSAQVDEAIVQQIEQEEPPTPVLAVQEQEMMQIEEETPRHRHRRRSRSRSGSRSRSRSRTRSRKASENLAHRRFESSSEASGPSHQEEEGAARARQGHSRGRRAADAIDFDKAIGAPMLEISRIATSLRASNEESENKAVQTPRNRAAKGVLADVLRGELPSFARAADSQDPTTLLGHPVALRLGREDLQEDEEAMEAKEAMWLQPPKFQVRLGLPPRKESKALAAPALPADWSLLKTMQFLHDHQSTSMEGKFHEEKKLQSNHAFPRRAAEKVPLENWFVGYFLETIDAEPAVGDELATNSFDMESFALPPLADSEPSTTASGPSERSLSMLPPLSLPSTPVTASPGRSPAALAPQSPWSPWMSPRQSPAGPSTKRLRRASSQTFAEGSPSFVARDLYQSPTLHPAGEEGGITIQGAAPPTETRRLLRQCIAHSTGADEEVLEAFELLAVLWQQAGQVSGLSWINCKLDWKLSHQLEDPLSVSSGALPLWATTLPRACPFLFSLQTRKMLLRYTALGPSLAVHWAQESKVGPYLRRRNSLPTELGAATQGDPRKIEELLQEVSNIEDHVVRSDFWLGALQSTLLRLQRNSGRPDSPICDVTGERSAEDQADELLLQQAEAAMERIAPSDRLLEVQFDTETGFGSAVTRSFYAEVARALQNRATNRKVPMWVEDDSSSSGSSGSGGGSSQHLRCRSGLWVRPLPPSTSMREAAECRFRFLGRLVGRALKDGFIVPLPLGEVFFARTLLGQKPAKLHESSIREPLAALPRPGAGCAGELCGTLADFVAALKSGEEAFRRKREEAGLGRPPAEELRSWRRSQGRERDFTTRFLAAGAIPEPMSFEDYMSLVGVSFLETGLSGAPLCPGGADRAVTVDNVEEFVELAHAYWCDDGVRGQLTAFREGLDEVIPVECFSAFSALELRDMICGEDSVEWGEQELLDHLRPSGGLTEQSPAYQHLVAVLLDMDQVNRSRFLDFVSSCPRFPPGGIDSFHVDVFPDSTAGRGFPRSRACANQLYLPLYRSKEELRERLHEAMHGSAGHHEQEQRILAS